MVRVLFCFCVLASALPARAGDFRAGAAAVKITPPVGTPMAGYYSERAAEGVHDDLYAKVLVLEKDGVRAALVSLDLISTTHEFVAEARREIEKSTGLRGQNVMISATHAHTGPVVGSRGLREKTLGGQSDLARRYQAELPARIARAVQQAEAALTPAQAWAARGREDAIAFNRRYHMADGSVGWNPGVLNPRIVKPAGPIDPDVPVVYFETMNHKPIAFYVNYAVHLDNIGGVQISADLPCTLARLLADVKGPDLVTVYTTGTCGDVNHINVNWSERQQGFANAARMGTILAAAVLRTLPALKPIQPGMLQCRTQNVALPLPGISPQDVDRARETVGRGGYDRPGKPSFLELVQAFKVLDVATRDGKPLEAEVQAITLGNELAWVGLPGEIFAELGLSLKQDSLFRQTMIAELANGSIGYVPSRRAFPQGNYEVVSARCAEGSGEMLVAAALQELKKMYLASARQQ
jgi:neutral ceramidase